MTDNFQDRLDAVFRSGGDQALLDEVYDAWARDYEKDIWASGNPQKALITGFVERHVGRPDARILDGGCGTGILTSILNTLGYRNIVGIDASEGMLDVARAKGCFAELHKMLLAAHIDLPDGSFDAAI
ncbi:MAG: methyltransferase domain-containing protein, partial [Rhizobiales bacterium]|nr:methyltransferase domain-containing protein [Hyphomicrobiales bacterium]